MNDRNAPNCIRCGLRGVYHRVTNPKQWRCRTCGHEFSEAELRALEEKKREEQRRKDEERRRERRRKQEEAAWNEAFDIAKGGLTQEQRLEMEAYEAAYKASEYEREAQYNQRRSNTGYGYIVAAIVILLVIIFAC